MKIIRHDKINSFQTKLIFQDGNSTNEIYVYVWEADNIETALKSLTWSKIKSYKSKTGSKTIKEEWLKWQIYQTGLNGIRIKASMF